MTLPFRRRRPDQWTSPHERARSLSAERLGGPLEASEAGWLDDHLAACSECSVVADAYRSQQAELWALADHQPQPPRDLWARTAAAIERESLAGRAGSAGAGRYRRIRSSALPLGAISGLLVVAVVIGASLLSQPVIVLPTIKETPGVALGSPPPAVRTSAPGPTPIEVAADVSYWKLGGGGTVDVYKSHVARVCPAPQGGGCPPLDEPSPQAIVLPDLPVSISKDPNNEQFVVVDSGTKGSGGSVFVVSPSTSGASPTPSVGPSPTPVTPTSTPSAPPIATATPASPASPPASAAPATASPSPIGASFSPAITTSPGGALQIARDVIVVGESEAYSPDGSWFAFTARPADGSHGPDIYVWRAGDAVARPITADHRSVFAAWLDNRILGSRGVEVLPTPSETPAASTGPDASGAPIASDAPATAEAPPSSPPSPGLSPAASTTTVRTFRAAAFLIDPATGVETPLSGVAAWRPAVDPTRRKAVYWDGSLQLDESGIELRPSDGHLVLGPWAAVPNDLQGQPQSSAPASESPVLASGEPGASTEPSSAPVEPGAAAPSPSAEPDAAASAGPSASAGVASTFQIATGQIRDWDARWDETGTHLAVWVADPADPRLGTLTLFLVDPDSGTVRPAAKVHDMPALAGFSIGKGRLAWVTPRQNGEGSRITVAAWKKDTVGSVETRQSPEEVVVVR